MVLYFSGTGNSRYAAQIIAEVNDDELFSMNDWIKARKKGTISSEKPLVFVCPVYCGRIPRVVEAFIRNSNFFGNKRAYFVLTCYAAASNSELYVKKLCKDTGFDFMGLKTVLMPQNHIAMYPILSKEEADRIIDQATPGINKIAKLIKQGNVFEESHVTLQGKLMSTVVNPIFYSMLVKAKAFRTTDECNGCGHCVELCPLNNIKITDGKPLWEDSCTHCMACINVCPNVAIEYGTKSVGKERYFNIHCK